MKGTRWIVAVTGLAIGVTGCLATSFALIGPTANGKAWAIGQTGIVQEVFLCEAPGDKEPVCMKQEEKP